MLKDLIVYLIYADNCKDCEEMRSVVYEAMCNSSYGQEHSKLEEINSESDKAIDLAIENDINDLPSCIIGEHTFCGKDSYTYDTMLNAIESIFENDSLE